MERGPESVVFAVGDSPEGKVVILGVPEAGWEYMRDGKSHTFDLRKVGLPFRIILFGGKDRESILSILPVGKGTIDMRGEDMGIH